MKGSHPQRPILGALTLAAALATAAAPASAAGPRHATLQVQARVVEACTVTAVPMPFGPAVSQDCGRPGAVVIGALLPPPAAAALAGAARDRLPVGLGAKLADAVRSKVAVGKASVTLITIIY